MKINTLLLILIFLTAVLHAQVKKVYGFVQPVAGGAMQDDNTGSKNNDKGKPANERYFVFAETRRNSAVHFQQVWIKGNLYDFIADTIKKYPLVLESSNGGELILRDSLIKSTKEQVIQLKDLTIASTAKAPLNIKKIIAANSIVIIYKCKGKTLAISLKTLKKLHPLFTQ